MVIFYTLEWMENLSDLNNQYYICHHHQSPKKICFRMFFLWLRLYAKQFSNLHYSSGHGSSAMLMFGYIVYTTRVRKEGIVMPQKELGISCIGISSEISRDISWSPSKVSAFYENLFVTFYLQRAKCTALERRTKQRRGKTWLESGHGIETSHLQGLLFVLIRSVLGLRINFTVLRKQILKNKQNRTENTAQNE